MNLTEILNGFVEKSVESIYGIEPNGNQIQFQKTHKEFEGDITLVVFPLLRISKKSPEQTAIDVGDYLTKEVKFVDNYNVVKGFLNLSVSDEFYLDLLNNNVKGESYGITVPSDTSECVMVEYSSPNTNKPLHLGHIRNNLLGYSLSKILAAAGKNVIKTNIVNDRGIHICKSMLAWQKWGNSEEPGENLKGDKLVGDYYVKFDVEFKKQVKEIADQEGISEDEASKKAPLLVEAQEMLRKWEAKDPEIYKLWSTMNQWVYDGFDVTYKRLGVGFDKIYYESETYIVGRDLVLEGLEKGIFIQKEDNSVWVDLTSDGLDQKILLRNDGTSVYMTQDIGTAQLRQKDYNPDKMVYVVGNEQNYHFKVLALILDKLGYSWAKGLYHMSYGMVELPEGKMKSREGTVVDADDLMDEMIETAATMSDELGKLGGLEENEKGEIYRKIGLGALKYFILKVDPTKNMTFDPKESIDFNGNTGPFIQYTYARVKSLFRKAEENNIKIPVSFNTLVKLSAKEKSIVKMIAEFPSIIKDAADNYSPALVANYTYDLVKEYNQFYHDHLILKEQNNDVRNFRLRMSGIVGAIINNAMNLLGIEMPERM